jgi:AcrR family transcriptional regulator
VTSPLPGPARRRRPRGSLTPETVLAAARTVVEREGLGGLSMPALARELDCGVMSLYSHFRNKDDLLTALAAAAMRDVMQHLPPAGDGPWDLELLAYFAAYRDALERTTVYREVQVHAPALVVALALVPAQLRRLDTGIGILHQAGLALPDAGAAYSVCLNYTRAFVAYEHGLLAGPGSDGPAEPWRLPDPESYPVLRRIPDAAQLLRVDDSGFALGLEILVDGIARRYGIDRTS